MRHDLGFADGVLFGVNGLVGIAAVVIIVLMLLRRSR